MKLRKGDVCLANLSGGFGHEQGGVRPATVLAMTDTSIVIAIPLTSNTEALRFSHTLLLPASKGNGLAEDSVALLFHLRAIDMRRIVEISGRLAPLILTDIDRRLRKLLSL
jgi:mRNA-degrading endonuclease toxin of MazEF toxin-antitoxin module